MILQATPNLRLWAYRLACAHDVPANGASMRVVAQRRVADGTNHSWSEYLSTNNLNEGLLVLARKIEPKAKGDWVVLAQFAFCDEGDNQHVYYHRESNLPARGGLRILYRRRWFARLFGRKGEVRVQRASYIGSEVSWTDATGASREYERLPLPHDNDVEIKIYEGDKAPGPWSLFQMRPGYTKRVEPCHSHIAALWLLCLVWHGYMERSGIPVHSRFTPTPLSRGV